MKIVKPGFVIEWAPPPEALNEHLERCARTCYRSQGKIGAGTAERLIRSVIERGHESVIEHAVITVRFVCDRGVSHELVRHRIASFSQESTRYVRYSGGDEEGAELAFVEPCFGWIEGSTLQRDWIFMMRQAEQIYLRMLGAGAKPEEARSVLPNSLRTEIVMTANMREWRHVLRLRTSPKAHPQMREIMIPLAIELAERYPVLFGDFANVGSAIDYAMRAGAPCDGRR